MHEQVFSAGDIDEIKAAPAIPMQFLTEND